MEIKSLDKWFEEFNTGPLFIAGPCSAESEEQVIETATQLNHFNIPAVFRSGLWKPRTRPGSFNGVGQRGLKWLQRVKKEFGFRIAVETAIPKHIEQCIQAGIDIIWIGARTTANPFSMEELSEALKGVDIPVMIKNPLTPDIDLWIGAIERIQAAGITRIAAIHRGFSPYERTVYRNMPKWELAIELRRRLKNIPVICDPSHIAGDSVLVPEVAQRALDLNMSGLMVEVHSDPPNAMSDNKQQLLPAEYHNMIQNLVVRSASSDDPVIMNWLDELRSQVDSIDYQMIELISRRMELSDSIGKYKLQNNLSVLQMERWMEILKTRIAHARELKVDTGFMEKFLKLLHQESIRRQIGIMSSMRNSGGESGDNDIDN